MNADLLVCPGTLVNGVTHVGAIVCLEPCETLSRRTSARPLSPRRASAAAAHAPSRPHRLSPLTLEPGL
jgi:hypothetical protein